MELTIKITMIITLVLSLWFWNIYRHEDDIGFNVLMVIVAWIRNDGNDENNYSRMDLMVLMMISIMILIIRASFLLKLIAVTVVALVLQNLVIR